MDKPVVTTPFRKAVDFLIESEAIDHENDLLPIVELESAGALSNYISTKPSKKVLRLFLKAFPQVSRFFESPGSGDQISAREFIDSLKADKERYIRIIESNLNTINTTLGKLVDLQERFHSPEPESDLNKKKPVVAKQALNPSYPDPFEHTGEGDDSLAKSGKIQSNDKSKKGKK